MHKYQKYLFSGEEGQGAECSQGGEGGEGGEESERGEDLAAAAVHPGSGQALRLPVGRPRAGRRPGQEGLIHRLRERISQNW